MNRFRSSHSNKAPVIVRFAVGLTMLTSGFPGMPSAFGQFLTDTSNQAMSIMIPLPSLVPANTSTAMGAQVQFRVRSNSALGYRVVAYATVTGLGSSTNGGSDLTSSDIGIGIVSVVPSGTPVHQPRVDTVPPGFNYDPTAVVAANGLTPYAGLAGGQATLADLLSAHSAGGITILSGPRIANNQNPNASNDFLTVTLKLGVLPQYFTPSSFSGVLVLEVRNGR